MKSKVKCEEEIVESRYNHLLTSEKNKPKD